MAVPLGALRLRSAAVGRDGDPRGRHPGRAARRGPEGPAAALHQRVLGWLPRLPVRAPGAVQKKAGRGGVEPVHDALHGGARRVRRGVRSGARQLALVGIGGRRLRRGDGVPG